MTKLIKTKNVQVSSNPAEMRTDRKAQRSWPPGRSLSAAALPSSQRRWRPPADPEPASTVSGHRLTPPSPPMAFWRGRGKGHGHDAEPEQMSSLPECAHFNLTNTTNLTVHSGHQHGVRKINQLWNWVHPIKCIEIYQSLVWLTTDVSVI